MTTAGEFMHTKLFQGVSTTDMAKIMLLAKEVSFPDGARVFSQGNRADLLYVILDGILDLTFHLKVGEVESEITIDTKRKGDSVGWSSIIAPQTYTLSGICRSPLSALTVEGESLYSLCEQDPNFGFVFMRNIAELIGTRMRQVQSMFIQEIQRGISMP